MERRRENGGSRCWGWTPPVRRLAGEASARTRDMCPGRSFGNTQPGYEAAVANRSKPVSGWQLMYSKH